MKDVLGSAAITPLIRNLDTRWSWVVSFTPQRLYTLFKSPWFPLDKMLVKCFLIMSQVRCVESSLKSWLLFGQLRDSTVLRKTRRFISIFTKACYCTVSWANSAQYPPSHPTSRRSILISSSHLHLSLSRLLFPWRLQNRILLCILYITPISSSLI